MAGKTTIDFTGNPTIDMLQESEINRFRASVFLAASATGAKLAPLIVFAGVPGGPVSQEVWNSVVGSPHAEHTVEKCVLQPEISPGNDPFTDRRAVQQSLQATLPLFQASQMSPRHLAPNTLAFFGPGHASELTEFCNVHLRRLSGEEAVAQVVRPDSDEDGQEISVPSSTFELRVVEAEKGQLWPGSYLAHPVALVQAGGPRTGQWAYGVVLRYDVNSKGTWLSVLSGEDTILVPLIELIRIIKADSITYVLQIGATVSDTTLNPRELLLQQDTVIGA
ncbi:hypothetical protein L917_02046 [Phytophthora nicotianae]|uniref:Uncharacterized protein n=1 Tax=Phytophthora nicotianae TaxID=4792 RepID=W2LXG3_PHYNI|nr:hypothetical protein L917_02046 [Phytophthora nicotianae]